MSLTINVMELCMDIPDCITVEEITDCRWQAARYAVRLHTMWLAIHETWSTERSIVLLVIQRWNCNNWWHHTEGKIIKVPLSLPRKPLNQVDIKSHGYREDRAIGMEIHLLDQHNADIGETVKTSTTCFDFQATLPKDIKWYHTKYQKGCGKLSKLTS